ncbi:MAG: PAS domain-containing sensor histidine kinase [Candidatus Nomurabacteria bacterium]|jgi:PAS domain S-box-containing protein|nr:PAS domain-containing sensor histidine kinase [Candidatus Nomurabacteria bacterium]
MKLFQRKQPDQTAALAQSASAAGQPSAEQITAKAIISSIDEGLILLSADGVITVFNPAAARITGWNTEEAINLNFLSIFRLVDSQDRELKEAGNPVVDAIKNRQPDKTDTFSIVTKHGEKLNLDLSVMPMEQGTLLVFRDITDRKKQDAEKTDFISTASHEMRTPVTAIDGYLGLLANPTTATIDERAKGYVEKAQSNVKHLGQLFQDLLDTTKADDNRINARPVPLNATEVAKGAVNDLSAKAAQKNLQLTYDAGQTLQPIYLILADRDQLLEVLYNIIENAIKYTAQGGVAVSVDGDDSKVRFKIQDTGVGITPEDLPHLFQKFYRIDNSDTREIGGTGLGLYLSKKLVDNMKGRIFVESVPSKGSAFFVELPRISEAEAKLATQTTPPLPPPPVQESTAPTLDQPVAPTVQINPPESIAPQA